MNELSTLTGFREFYPKEYFFREYIFQNWRKTAKNFNFQEFDSPVLEPIELFTKKSSDEILSQLFSFQDKSGRLVALRPEMTPSLIRLIASKFQSIKKPIKWFNIGENFRYERPQKGRIRSFFQFNADIVGEESLLAEAEIITLLVKTLTSFKLKKDDFYIRLSDRTLWTYFIMEYDLDENKINDVLNIIDKIDHKNDEGIIQKLNFFFKEKTNQFFKDIKTFINLRSLQDIESYFINSSNFYKNKFNISQRILSWKILLNYLKHFNVIDFIKIDMSIVRGLSYYTGFVFEAFSFSEKRALAGGGRYDQLSQKLMNIKIPAIGFAIGDVVLLDLLQKRKLIPKYKISLDVFFVIEDEELIDSALKDISILRENNITVDLSYRQKNINKQIKEGISLNSRIFLVYSKTNTQINDEVLLKNFTKKIEKKIKRNNLLKYIILELKN